MDFLLPPVQRTATGELRRVGFELEFAGVDLETAAAVVQHLFGGTLVRKNRFQYVIESSTYGRFSIELDSAVLKHKLYQSYLEKLGIHLADFSFTAGLESMLARLASTVVPFEVVSPPIPLTDLRVMEELKTLLRKRRALGTRSSFLYAFGLHFNPEVPALDATVLLKYLRAFLLLYRWIFDHSGIDFSRRLTPFIKEFPGKYLELVLNPAYRPDLRQLIDDYLDQNPTRNRPLDMLPAFAVFDREKVLARAVEKNLIKPRPAFHYRLPNCLIDDPSWTIASEWNYWVEVEKLAADPARIENMSRDYLKILRTSLPFMRESWSERTEEWLRKGS